MKASDLLLNLDGFNHEVLIGLTEFETHLKDSSALLLSPTLFLHLCVLEPPLIGIGLNLGDQGENELCL